MGRQEITHLFLDIGNVILTNGWDRKMRRKAANTFRINYDEMDERHHLTFDTYAWTNTFTGWCFMKGALFRWRTSRPSCSPSPSHSQR